MKLAFAVLPGMLTVCWQIVTVQVFNNNGSWLHQLPDVQVHISSIRFIDHKLSVHTRTTIRFHQMAENNSLTLKKMFILVTKLAEGHAGKFFFC